MSLKNTAERFGSLTKILHWSIFLLFIVQFFLVYRREYFQKDSPESLQYILLHESIGVCLLLMALLMLIWRQAGQRPVMPNTMLPIEITSAKVMHFILYLLMILQPITGIAMSELAGYEVGVFGWFNLPMLLAKNEALAKIMHTVHVWTSYAIIAFVSMHAIAGLYHHFVKKDNVLTRMLPKT